MKVDWCKILGHKYRPVFYKGDIKGVEVKIITCYCERCKLGRKEMRDFSDKLEPLEMATYQEKYFYE
tara:strand:- start:89 stop:289 length:201 start_codon:yes stop_codon:yes gene_type:complete